MSYFRETVALSALNEAIKKLESEMQNKMEAGEPI
jgi:DNA-binding protein YbaB